MELEPQKTAFDERLEDVEKMTAEIEAEEKRDMLLAKFREGSLSWSEYKSLAQNFQTAYVSMWGKPEDPSKRLGRDKKVAKRKAAAKRAKQARKRNRK